MSLVTEYSRVFELNRIPRETAFKHLEFRQQVPSTNDRALELAAAETIETPVLVLAESQTAGRGRGINRWWAGQGALTFSLVVATDSASLPIHRRPTVSLTAGLAVCEAVRELFRKHDELRVQPPASTKPTGGTRWDPRAAARGLCGPSTLDRHPRIGLKWPNDVLLQGRKVSGILVEASSARPDRLVIGIGINVNNSVTRAPAELQSTATALVDHGQTPLDLTEVLIEVLQQLTAGLEMLTTNDEALFDCWQHYCVLQGRTVTLDLETNRVRGLCRGIDVEGALVLETDDGQQRFISGVVSAWE